MSPYMTSFHRCLSILEPEGFAHREVRTIEASIDLHCATEPPWPIDQLPIDFNSPDQHG
jgi:hypothetical protein